MRNQPDGIPETNQTKKSEPTHLFLEMVNVKRTHWSMLRLLRNQGNFTDYEQKLIWLRTELFSVWELREPEDVIKFFSCLTDISTIIRKCEKGVLNHGLD